MGLSKKNPRGNFNWHSRMLGGSGVGSRYNWQKRLLQYSVSKCGIVPDLPPTPPVVCDDIYIVSFTDPTASSFSGWTLNGYPDFDWGSLAASFGGNYILDYSSLSPVFSPPSLATFTYKGPTPPPDLVGTDAFSNPVSYSFTKYCDKSVLQITTDGLAGGGNISNITIGDINLDLLLYGGPVYIGDPAAPNIITSALQTYFGPDAYCLIHLTNGYDGYPFTIDLFNVYTNTAVNFNSVGSFSMLLKWNANEFDFTSVTPLSFSDISYNSGSGLYVYGLQYINWTVPADFEINIQFSCVYNYYYASSISPGITLFDNGDSSATDPFSNSMNLNVANNTLRISNGNYIQLASCDTCGGGSYNDTIDVRCPYLGYSSIDSIINDVRV